MADGGPKKPMSSKQGPVARRRRKNGLVSLIVTRELAILFPKAHYMDLHMIGESKKWAAMFGETKAELSGTHTRGLSDHRPPEYAMGPQ